MHAWWGSVQRGPSLGHNNSSSKLSAASALECKMGLGMRAEEKKRELVSAVRWVHILSRASSKIELATFNYEAMAVTNRVTSTILHSIQDG